MTLDEWIAQQIAIVEQDGTHCQEIRLEGSSGETWGTWPIGFPDLAQTVQTTISGLSDNLADGHHACRLWAVDSTNHPRACFPWTVNGRSRAASSAATEHQAMQKAVALAQSNFEAQTLGLRNENTRLQERLAELMENQSLLVERLIEISSANLDTEIRMADANARREAFMRLAEDARPAFTVFATMAAEWFGRKLTEGKPDAQTPEPTATESPISAASNGHDEPPSASPDGASSDPANDRARVPPSGVDLARPAGNRGSTSGGRTVGRSPRHGAKADGAGSGERPPVATKAPNPGKRTPRKGRK